MEIPFSGSSRSSPAGVGQAPFAITAGGCSAPNRSLCAQQHEGPRLVWGLRADTTAACNVPQAVHRLDRGDYRLLARSLAGHNNLGGSSNVINGMGAHRIVARFAPFQRTERLDARRASTGDHPQPSYVPFRGPPTERTEQPSPADYCARPSDPR